MGICDGSEKGMRGNDHPKKNCLIIFRDEHRYSHLLIEKMNVIYNSDYIFSENLFYKHGSKGIINLVNKRIKENSIEVVFFDIDGFPVIDSAIINQITNKVIKVLLTFDDLVMHNLNVASAAVCDLVLTADPVSVLKFKEKGLDAEYMPLESAKTIYHPLDASKDIDVLFYGDLEKEGRRQYIDHIRRSGIDIRVIDNSDEYVTPEELVKLINRAKIVLNFSRTDQFSKYREIFGKSSRDLDLTRFQLKGRIFEAALCKTLCISENCPAIGLLFLPEEVPVFENETACVRLLNRYLADDELRDSSAAMLYHKVLSTYEDTMRMPEILKLIENLTIKPKRVLNNNYYRSYVTMYKLKHAMVHPGMLMREIFYLYKNDLLSFFPFVNNAPMIVRGAMKQLNSKAKAFI